MKFLRALIFALFALGAVASAAEVRRPPNVVIVLTDDQGYGDLGCLGNPWVKTPAIDALYHDSVRLTNFHTDPTCAPTRAALMTGEYATRVGVWHTLQGRSIMRLGEKTMAEFFRDAGYRTGLFGKWHLGEEYPYRPQDRGFQDTVINGGAGVGQNPDYWGNTYADAHYKRDGQWEKFDGYCTDIWFREATRFVERNRDAPFFCFLPLNAAHYPHYAPAEYVKPYLAMGMDEARAVYFGMIAAIDANVGQFRRRLAELGLEDNTLFIFMSDNGPMVGKNAPKGGKAAAFAFDAGMRGGKGSPYENGHRLPCFFHWPAGKLTGGRDVAQLTAHFDLLPTLIELCGLPSSALNPFDGRSLAPLLRQEKEPWPERTLVVHNPRVERPQKWVRSAVMADQWRLVNGTELYDLATDPGQKKDLASGQPEKVAQLRADYEKWWTSVSPRFDEFVRVYVGAPEENPVKLTCHDWHWTGAGELPTWNQSVIAAREQGNGWWTAQVARAGVYTFRGQDLPDEATEDKRIQAVTAELTIDGKSVQLPVPTDATSVTFAVTLPAGPARIDTKLTTATGETRGIPILYVEWKGPAKP